MQINPGRGTLPARGIAALPRRDCPGKTCRVDQCVRSDAGPLL